MKCLPGILSASTQYRCPHHQLKLISDIRLLNKSQSVSALFVKGKQGIRNDISINVICLSCRDGMYVFFVYFQFISSVPRYGTGVLTLAARSLIVPACLAGHVAHPTTPGMRQASPDRRCLFHVSVPLTDDTHYFCTSN